MGNEARPSWLVGSLFCFKLPSLKNARKCLKTTTCSFFGGKKAKPGTTLRQHLVYPKDDIPGHQWHNRCSEVQRGVHSWHEQKTLNEQASEHVG